MQLSLQRKRALFWGLGILVAAALISVAWMQINLSLSRCFSIF